MTTSDVSDVSEATAPAAKPPGPLRQLEIARSQVKTLEALARHADGKIRAARERLTRALGCHQFVRGLWASPLRYEERPDPDMMAHFARAGLRPLPSDADLNAAGERIDAERLAAGAEVQAAERATREMSARCEQAQRDLATAEADLEAEMRAANVTHARAGGRLLVRQPGRLSESALPEVEDA
jgi:hypothetical protein